MTSTSTLRRYVLLVATLASFLTPFMGSSVNIAIPSIGHDLDLDAVTLNWVVTSYLLASAVFLLPFGRAADLFGRKKVFLAGVQLYTVSSLLCGLAATGWLLIVFRVVQGIGSAMIFSTGIAILCSVFPQEERGRVLGITVAAVYTGLAVGPPVGGFLTHQLGWQSLFYFNFLLGLVVIWATIFKLRGEWKDEREAQFDLAGSFLYTLGLTGVLYGIASVESGLFAWVSLGTGVVLLIGFGARELHFQFPLFDLRLFRNTPFAFSNLAALIHYSATFGLTLILSLYLQEVQGLNAQAAGFVLLAQPVLMALVSPLAGRLSDRIEPRILASVGMGMTGLGLAVFTQLHETTPIVLIVVTLVWIGTGYAFFSSPNANAIMSSVKKVEYGVASATLATMRVVGQATSMALVTFFFAIYLKDKSLEAAGAPLLMKSFHLSFLVFAILCGFAILASLARGKIRTENGSGRTLEASEALPVSKPE